MKQAVLSEDPAKVQRKSQQNDGEKQRGDKPCQRRPRQRIPQEETPLNAGSAPGGTIIDIHGRRRPLRLRVCYAWICGRRCYPDLRRAATRTKNSILIHRTSAAIAVSLHMNNL